MTTFTLHFVYGSTLKQRTMEVSGDTIADAILNSDLDPGYYSYIEAYEVNGERHQVAAMSNCGCWYHAEEGRSCNHDLALIGVVEPAEPSISF